jgi:acetylornithine deacetylase/succinyl-diaminopimelate desuccinylase-like protein
MSENVNKALEYASSNKKKFLDEMAELIAIPSISTDSASIPDVQRAAEWLEVKLKALNFDNVQIMPTDGLPIVYGEHLKAGKDAPTMLVYGHYDVQPADPLELWDSEPFTAKIDGDMLFARGSSDMKGQVIASLAAVESILAVGESPINIKFMLEGEEETGSPTLGEFIETNKDLFAADFALNPDAGMLSASQPTITYALRGLAYFQVEVSGPSHDLHSGLYGGAVRNPANELAKLIAGMHDENNRVTLPGFYEDVRDLDQNERDALAKLPQDDQFYLDQTGVSALWGEEGFSSNERATGRPTLDVNGIISGYIGEGSKTVLPASAMAKISCRLVANQDPKKVLAQMQAYFKSNAHPSLKWEVKLLNEAVASISELDSSEVMAMSQALQHIWGTEVLFKREGGTIPVVGYMQDKLGIESILTGFGLPEDRIHSPNERLNLNVWEKGIQALIHFIFNLG